jgi:hypothetical protein
MIGLPQFIEPPLPVPETERTRLRVGDDVFVMHTDDVRDVHRRLLAEPKWP